MARRTDTARLRILAVKKIAPLIALFAATAGNARRDSIRITIRITSNTIIA